MVRIVEGLEYDLKNKTEEITKLRSDNGRLESDLKKATDRLPEAAVARAEHEWRYNNKERASRELEKWFDGNASSVAKIAKHLAQFHISRAIPDPGDHLEHARNLLRLARGALPGDREAQELESELDRVNAGLQEQLLHDGDAQIAWNSGMAPRLGTQGEQFRPAVVALDAVASYCFEKGLWRLASIFGDRAADIAQWGGLSLRRTWYVVETRAAGYERANGRAAKALERLDRVLADLPGHLPERDQIALKARYCRIEVLHDLSRYGEALVETESLIPILAEAAGARSPETLSVRNSHADMLHHLNKLKDSLAEIDDFGPIQAEVLGVRHANTLATRHLRAMVLHDLKRYEEALNDIDDFLPVSTEVFGPRHPDVLTTRTLRASVLAGLGRPDEAIKDIDDIALTEAEVLGARHPHVLISRHLRAQVLTKLGRRDEALKDIDDLIPIEAELFGQRHPHVLATRSLRADVLGKLGRNDEARAQIAPSRQRSTPQQIRVTSCADGPKMFSAPSTTGRRPPPPHRVRDPHPGAAPWVIVWIT